MTGLHLVGSNETALGLYRISATRRLEQFALAHTPPGALMRKAGESAAQLAKALAPNARHFCVLCGPGNNGGDGLIAAAALQRQANSCGWRVSVLMPLGGANHGEAAHAMAAAKATGINWVTHWPEDVDLAIDALLGIGARTVLPERLAPLLSALHQSATVLAIDGPSGLNLDTGEWQGPPLPSGDTQRHTLALLTLKPGLFTAHGRDAAGQIWLDDLDWPRLGLATEAPDAWTVARPAYIPRAHHLHKGSFGQVTVIGGQTPTRERIGMTGAAKLAARAALHQGAGRVYLCTLGDSMTLGDDEQPDIMVRSWQTLIASPPSAHEVWVVGCGAGEAITPLLPTLLAHPGPLVLDADALNALAMDAHSQAILAQRTNSPTVLTPHPLEAARLLGLTTAQVQADRLGVAQTLSERLRAVVVLKGSGSIVAAPERTPLINTTGNARLAIAGTGDVLAGMVGAQLAQTEFKDSPHTQLAAAAAVFRHGEYADLWPTHRPLTAHALARVGGWR